MARKQISENKVVVSTSGAAAAPARRQVASPKRVPRATAPTAEVSNAAVSTPKATTPVAGATPSFEAISLQAYLYWEARGGQGGSCEQDWLRAERELAGK